MRQAILKMYFGNAEPKWDMEPVSKVYMIQKILSVSQKQIMITVNTHLNEVLGEEPLDT